MTTKKHWTLRAAGLLFALVLITSCFVGGTFAKYVTSKSASDSARVAKFGVVIEAQDNTAFKTAYATDDAGVRVGANSVATSTTDSLVAPGTKEDNAVTFSITGTPEVAVRVALSMTGTDVFLKDGTYPDLTTANPNDKFILTKPYYPVVFTLKKDGTELARGTISEINTKLGALSKDCAPGTNLSTDFGTYTLSWEWAFEDADIDNKDQADTLLGTLATSATAVPGVGVGSYSPLVHLELTATVTQID